MVSIAVIGGGVIGVCCALQLQQRGHKVTVIERNAVGEGAAWASCGFIASSEVVPLSRPGTFRKIPGWLMNPTGPLAIRPASLPGLLPWMLRFAGNARPQRMRYIAEHLSPLALRARADFDTMLSNDRLQGLIGDKPVIEVYDTEAELAHERPYHDIRRAQGFSIDEISGAEAAELEPALAQDFARAAVFNDWRAVVDTRRFVSAISEAFVANGGSILRDEVLEIQRNEQAITGLRLRSGDSCDADQFVLAAGAWSAPLAMQLGLALPIAALMGYQTMVTDPQFSMQHGVIYAAGGFGITPYEQGIGIAGTIEFAALDASPNYQRARILVKKARRVVPGLTPESSVERVGRRPFCPDTLPIISRAQGLSNLVLATGHGQLGITLGATTGLLVAQIIGAEPSAVDLAAYRHTRFQGQANAG